MKRNPVSCPTQIELSNQKPNLEKAVADILIPMITPNNDFKIEFAICAYSSDPQEGTLYVLRDPLEVNFFLASNNYDMLEFRVKEDLDNAIKRALAIIKRRKIGNYEEAYVMIDPEESNGLVFMQGKWSVRLIKEVIDTIFTGRYKKSKSENNLKVEI